MNQKGSATVILLVIVIIILAGIGGYYFLKKPINVAVSPTPTTTKIATPTPETANWKTYANTQYGFSFKYPSNIFAYDAVDYTNGQIPDVAGFGYTKPGQYELGTTPAEKMGSARILVWTNVLQGLKSWTQTHEYNVKSWTDTKIGDIAALVNYSKAATASEGSPMTFKTYYLKTGNEIIEITGSSVTNQYSDNWIVNFDKIVATFKFTTCPSAPSCKFSVVFGDPPTFSNGCINYACPKTPVPCGTPPPCQSPLIMKLPDPRPGLPVSCLADYATCVLPQ